MKKIVFFVTTLLILVGCGDDPTSYNGQYVLNMDAFKKSCSTMMMEAMAKDETIDESNPFFMAMVAGICDEYAENNRSLNIVEQQFSLDFSMGALTGEKEMMVNCKFNTSDKMDCGRGEVDSNSIQSQDDNIIISMQAGFDQDDLDNQGTFVWEYMRIQ